MQWNNNFAMQLNHNKNSQHNISSISDYSIEIEIGRGSSGTCFKATHKSSKEIYAIKKIPMNNLKKDKDRDRTTFKEAMKQVTILKSLKHPNIIEYHESFTDENNFYIVMEFASKGDLHTILKRRKLKQQFYEQKQIWSMAKQLLSALKYLHDHHIVHRDFKTLNIFVNQQNQLMVGDLGVSKILKTDLGLYSRVGTPLYLAPEIIKYEKYDYKADVWGLGCVLYLITTLSHPFQGKNIISLGQNIVQTQPKPIQGYSEQLNHLILAMLRKDPQKRPNPQKLINDYLTNNIVPSMSNIENQKDKRTSQKSLIVTNQKPSPKKQIRQQTKTIQSLLNCKEKTQKNKYPEIVSIGSMADKKLSTQSKEINQQQILLYQQKKSEELVNNKVKKVDNYVEEKIVEKKWDNSKYVRISDLKQEQIMVPKNNQNSIPMKISTRPTTAMVGRHNIKYHQKQAKDNKLVINDNTSEFQQINLDDPRQIKQQNKEQRRKLVNSKPIIFNKNMKNRYVSGSSNKINKIIPSYGSGEDMTMMKNNFQPKFYDYHIDKSHSKLQKRPNANNCSKIYFVGEVTQKDGNKNNKTTQNEKPFISVIEKDKFDETQLRDKNRIFHQQDHIQEKQLKSKSINFRSINSAKMTIEKNRPTIKKNMQAEVCKSQANKIEQQLNSIYIQNKERPKSSVCGRSNMKLKHRDYKKRGEQQHQAQWSSDNQSLFLREDRQSDKHTRTQILKKPEIVMLL